MSKLTKGEKRKLKEVELNKKAGIKATYKQIVAARKKASKI